MADILRAIAYLRSGDWEAAHQIVQEDDSPEGSWAHGIVHMLEGDVANARYWYRRAGRQVPEPDAIASEIEVLAAAVRL